MPVPNFGISRTTLISRGTHKFVIPRASRDEHRSSVFYYYERGDSLEFMRIKLKSAELKTGRVELDVMQLHGHWPGRMGLDD